MTIYSPTEHIEFCIFNNFLGLNELATMSMVNKSYNSLAVREIKKLYLILEKISASRIIINNSSLYSDSLSSYKYNQNYWYELFGKKLNMQELAIYYAHFISQCRMNSNNWCCVAFNDGFIKQLGTISDGSVSLSPDEPEIYIRFYSYSNKNIYIEFEINNGIVKNTYIDADLLKKCIKYIFQNTNYNQRPIQRPTINDTIEYLYSIHT